MQHLLKMIPTHWVLNCATLGPVGYSKRMPGTYGSFIGLLFYTLFFHSLMPLEYVLSCLVSFWFACIICNEAELILYKKDPACIILDEMIAMPFCFLGLQKAMQRHAFWYFMILGFTLFRFFDIVKPLGIKRLQEIPGGMGIVIDDIAAALLTCALLHAVFNGILN